MSQFVLNPDAYHYSIYAIPVLLVGTALAGLGCFVAIHEGRTKIGGLFLFFTLTVSLYLTGMGISYTAGDVRAAMFWIKIAHIGLVFIPSTGLLLAVSHLKLMHRYHAITAGVFIISAFLCFAIFFTDSLLKGVSPFFWGYYGQYGPSGIATLVFIVIVMAFILKLYWKEYRLSKTERQKKRFRGIVIAFGIGTLGVVDVIPTFGIGFYPFGYIPMFSFLVVIAYTITHYRFVDISPESAVEQILEMMQGAVIVVDMENRVRVVNREALEMLGYQKADLLDKELQTVLDVKDIVNAPCDIRSQEMVWSGRNGRQFDVVMSSSPVTDARGNSPIGVVFVAHDITRRKQAEQDREKLIIDLQKALSDIKTLHGILPICSQCKKIRDEAGAWHQLEAYITEHTDSQFTHGLCKDCAKQTIEEADALIRDHDRNRGSEVWNRNDP